MAAKNISGSSFQTTNKINSDASSLSQKYGGLIHRSPYKKFRMNMITLFNYIYTIAPDFQLLHNIVSVIRILQFVGPSLIESCPAWKKDNVGYVTAGVLSIFWHLLPPMIRDIGGPIICFLYAIVSLLIFVLIVVSSMYFNKFAQLPIFIPWIIAGFFALCNFIFPPIVLNFSFENLGRHLFIGDIKFNMATDVVAPVLNLISFIIFSWLFTIIVTQTLIFRPISLMTVMISTQNIFYFAVNFINAVIGFSSYCSPVVQSIVISITGFIYLVVAYLPFYIGGFVNNTVGCLISAGGITGAVMVFAHSATTIMQISVGLPYVFLLIILFTILSVCMRYVDFLVLARHARLLDRYQDERNIDIIKNPLHFINCVAEGMTIAHPACINWDIFKAYIDIAPKDTRIWYIFAKYCSIYPEDTQTISWIYHAVLSAKLKGTTARTIKEQVLSIAKQRESNLSANLKTKLGSVQKQMQNAKHKLRHVWDLAIQGNIGEMEQSIKRFYAQQDKVDAEYKHLFRQYPNNRFLTRAYSRFAKELVANHQEYLDYVEKSKQLQRGIIVNEDSVHKFGMYAYPNLPTKLCRKMIEATSGDFNQSGIEAYESDADENYDDALSAAVRDNIEKLTIPSIMCTKISRVLMLAFIYIGLIVALFAVTIVYINNLTDPLIYLYDLSLLESRFMMLRTFGIHYFYEQIGVYRAIIPQERPPYLFGGVYDTKEMLYSIISQVTTATQNVYNLRSFKTSNKNIKQSQQLIFGPTLKYVYFNSLTLNKTLDQTLQTGAMDIVNQVSNMLKRPVDNTMVNQSYILNPIYNGEVIDDALDKALNFLVDFFADQDRATKQIVKIVMFVGIFFVIIAFLVALIIQLIWIQNNKEEAYRCLTALPKNAVSGLVENLRVLKNDDENSNSTCTDTEMSKQEDNIMKILVTGGDTSSNKIADRIMLIVGSILTIVLEVVVIFMFAQLIMYESQQLISSAPHMNYLPSTFVQALALHYYSQLLALTYEDNPNKTHVFSVKALEYFFHDRRNYTREYYHKGRFGGRTKNEAPFAGFNKAVVASNAYINCDDFMAMPVDFMDMAACSNVEALFLMFDALVLTMYTKHQRGSTVFKSNNIMFDYLWTLLINPIYEGIFGPLFEGIIKTIDDSLEVRKKKDFPVLLALLVIGVVFECFVFIQVLMIEKHIRSVLRLLMHMQQSVVMNTQKIMMVLHGDFSKMKGDTTKRSAEFFDTVFKLLPDALMICDTVTYNITSVSKACSRVLFMDESEIVGKNMKDIITTERFTGDVASLFKGVVVTGIELVERDPDGSIIYLDVSTMKANNQFVFILRDKTSSVRYNTLIQDERAKSDRLLASILPQSLVMRVQAGEKNISFSVQSATILFLDIVSFTPWCGSNEATKVMMTLNLMFKKLDATAAKYPTMTKIKCIGDCYMAAGGIFSEINNPTEHAREVVSFGVDAIDRMKELNRELNEKLKIRVGINSGGPIVAGVLGIGKPTFEILGPAINMAQQMEHHGVPMAVHISRSVYELIYGESFKVKERGSIEVKKGSVLTYIVEEKT